MLAFFLDQGEVFAWGNNEYRQLGVSSDAPQLCLPEVVNCSALDGVVTAIAAGGGFTAFLTCEIDLDPISMTCQCCMALCR